MMCVPTSLEVVLHQPKKEEYWQGTIPWISSADIYGVNDLKPRRKITSEAVKNSATNILPKGGIVVVTW